MSNLLEQASLVMIPSGYKEDVVYSQIPLDGSGDMTLTRASNGTRINSAGLVEVCPWNLLEYSEELNNAYWQKNLVTINSNTTVAPNGTTTADTFTNSSTGYGIYAVVNVVPSQQYTFSFYIKKGTNTSYILSVIDAVSFNSISSLDYSSQVSATDWVRITRTFTTPSTTTSIRVYQMRDGSTTGTAFLWGAQLNTGELKPYFPTTDRLNVPRLTYQNGGGGCPSLLLEKQSTNLVTYSEDFTQWTTLNTTVTANNTTSPDGTQNADVIAETTVNSEHQFASSSVSFLASTKYTATIFVKWDAACTRNIHIRLGNCPSVNCGASFDKNGNFVNYTGGGNGTLDSYSSVDMGNGWRRFVVTITTTTTASSGSGIFVYFMNGTSLGYAGSTSQKINFYGAQLEASSYPTSYIPTTSSSATRVADACYKTGISSLIGQTEGFIAGEVEGLTNSYGSQSTIISVSDGTTANRVMFSFNASTGYVTPRIFKAGSTIFVEDFAITLTQKIKFAIGWGGGRAVCYVNGTQAKETTGLTFFSSGTLTRFGADDGAGSNIGIGKVSEYILGTTNLTNLQLQSLTL